MKESLHELVEGAKYLFYLVPAFVGGLVDYFNQLQRGDREWSFIGFAIHMLSALFFGWMAGAVVSEFGYGPNMIAASGGLGGFLGVRLADLVVYRFFKVERRTGRSGPPQ